ncbi:NUDIX domain-containing protein [Pedobacter sp. P351]|uniref:NUDIX domain-containing protein n=1 Tax=Pedobacter superstes TaxID=3133441 RepID=UPI0030A9D4E1
MYKFNVRVYGLLINEANQILISDEEEYGVRFSKFPGGGLEYGEGLIEALKREFIEECDLQVDITEHFYTTDFFVKSAFNDSQIISVYYIVKPLSDLNIQCKEAVFDFDDEGDIRQAFRWKNVADLEISDVTFPTDQRIVELLKNKWNKA